MTQDFAKQHRPTPQGSISGPPRWVWFFTGLFTGAFITFLGALWYFVPSANDGSVVKEKPIAEPETQVEEMQWDFYEIFPKSVVPIVEEYAETGEKITTEEVSWILQAGSFTDPNDADEMRASLILMGLDVTVSEVKVSGTNWHRVIIGPFETQLDRNRAQDRLAQAQIESIAIKVRR